MWECGCRLIVVDDGSREEYAEIFDAVSDICVILRHPENRGKGAAIKSALTYIEETYVSTEMVSRWERGKNSPSIDCLVTLACVLECTLDYLILGDDFINKVYGMYISDDKVDLVKRVVAELIK